MTGAFARGLARMAEIDRHRWNFCTTGINGFKARNGIIGPLRKTVQETMGEHKPPPGGGRGGPPPAGQEPPLRPPVDLPAPCKSNRNSIKMV